MVINKLAKLLQLGEGVALATVVKTRDSSPRGVGAMMIVDAKGNLVAGTIGGGAVEERAKSHAAELLGRGISKALSYNLGSETENGESLDMACGGEIEVFFRVFPPQDKIIIAGAGHIAQKLCKMGKILGYHITVVDDRKELLTKERFEGADTFLHGDIPKELKRIPIDSNTNIVIITHGHKYDTDALEAVIDRPVRYVGMIGSSTKVRKCFEVLKGRGVNSSKFAKVYAPIGIDLGGERPEDISLSILAQIQAVKHNKEVASFKPKI